MKALRSSLLGLTLALVATPALAQFQEDVRFETARPYGSVIGSYPEGNYYVGPYQLSLVNSPAVPWFDVYCLDFQHSVWSGVEWRASFTPLSVSDAVLDANTRFGSANRGNYMMAAWLSTRFYTTMADRSSEWPGLHAAIWALFPQNLGEPTYSSTVITDWHNQASAGVAGTNPDYWFVVSDVRGERQEFLTYVTPEPETVFLLGTGLVAVLGMSIVMRRSLG
jgi:hypothetical protein